jgi:hypothetical protein
VWVRLYVSGWCRAQLKYNMPNLGKALRNLIQYAAVDGDEALIFGKVRCGAC